MQVKSRLFVLENKMLALRKSIRFCSAVMLFCTHVNERLYKRSPSQWTFMSNPQEVTDVHQLTAEPHKGQEWITDFLIVFLHLLDNSYVSIHLKAKMCINSKNLCAPLSRINFFI